MNRKRWLFALLLVPLALAIPLYSAASWRPHVWGVHPFPTRLKNGNLAFPRMMLSPDGKRLLTFVSRNSDPRGLVMWDVEREKMLWKKTQSGAWDDFALCFSPDSQTLVAVQSPVLGAGGRGKPSQLELLDCADGRPVRALGVGGTNWIKDSHWIDHAVFAPDGRNLTVAIGEGIVAKDIIANRVTTDIRLPRRHFAGVATVTLARDGQSFVFNVPVYRAGKPMNPSYRAELRDLNNRTRWKMPATKMPAVGDTRFDFSPDDSRLLVTNSPSQIEMRDAKNGHQLWQKSLAGTNYKKSDWLADGSAVVVDMGREYRLLNAETGQLMRILGHREIQHFVVAPNGNSLYSIDAKGQIARQRLK